MKTYFYSDPHFGHHNIIDFASRDFTDVKDMEEYLIKAYNNVVGEDDQVIWVGDCFFTSAGVAADIMDKLNGKKILVRGNHDGTPARMRRIGFDFVCEEMVLKLAGHRVRISHYPFAQEDYPYDQTDRAVDSGDILIHGHTHSPDVVSGRMIHVGVDAWNYKPVAKKQIEKLVQQIHHKTTLPDDPI